MIFELNTWRTILAECDAENDDILRINLEKENDRIISALIDSSVHLSKEEAEQQVRFHLVAICNLGDKVPKIVEPAKRELVENMLIRLLSGLETVLLPCWPNDFHLPGFQWKRLLPQMRDQLPAVRSRLAEYGVDPELIDLMMNLWEQYLAEEWEMTYYRWYKIRDLLAALEEPMKASPPGGLAFKPDPTDNAIDLLMQLNFHNYSIFKYLQERTSRSADRYQDPSDQAVFLKSLLGYIRNNDDEYIRSGQLPHTGLRNMYIEFLIALIQEKEKNRAGEPSDGFGPTLPPNASLPNGLPPEDLMILTTLSSSQLGCMIRLFVDTGIFANDNLKQVAEFMAAFVSTKKRGPETDRSVNNLYANIYTIAPGTSAAVDEILHRMLDRNAELREEMAARASQPLTGRRSRRKNSGQGPSL